MTPVFSQGAGIDQNIIYVDDYKALQEVSVYLVHVALEDGELNRPYSIT